MAIRDKTVVYFKCKQSLQCLPIKCSHVSTYQAFGGWPIIPRDWKWCLHLAEEEILAMGRDSSK